MSIGQTAGRYRILARVAAGGMGEVYRARMETADGFGKVLALKLVRPEHARDKDFAALFVEEAKIAMSLSHANVVQSFDVGRIDDRWFLAMEYVDGTNLALLLRACRKRLHQKLPHRFALFIAVEALKGLDYAHRRKGQSGELLHFVHRDISPGNLLISYEGEVKVADFGIAKSTMRQFGSMAGTIKGKIPYMAPEQVSGAHVDRRADIYSMGAVLYEMLTDRRLIEGDSGPAAIPAVLAGDFPRPRDVKPDIPAELERIALKALCGDREIRYASAAAMRQDLEAFALSAGYLLSSSDLADFVREASEKKPTDPPPDGAETEAESVPSKLPTTPLSAPAPAKAPGENAFDALLGAELERLDAAEPFSVFTSGRGGRISRPSTASIERSSSSSLPRSSTVSIDVDVDVDEPAIPSRPPIETSPSTLVPRPSPARHLLWAVPLVLVAIVGTGLLVTRADDPERAPDASPPPRDPPPLALSGDEPATEELPIGADTPEVPPVAPEPPPDRPVKQGRTVRERPAPTAMHESTEQRPPPAAGAQLSVNTDPWSYVYVDGRRVRHTPLLGHSLPAGRHTLRFHNPELGLERSQTVDLAPGEHRRISLDLQ